MPGFYCIRKRKYKQPHTYDQPLTYRASQEELQIVTRNRCGLNSLALSWMYRGSRIDNESQMVSQCIVIR